MLCCVGFGSKRLKKGHRNRVTTALSSAAKSEQITQKII